MTDLVDIAMGWAKHGYSDGGVNHIFVWDDLEPSLQGEPWCAGMVSDAARESGHALPAIDHPWGYSYCPDGIDYFKSHGLWSTSGLYHRNDIIFYDWQGDGVSDHTGIVVSDDGHTIVVVEGNTVGDGQSGSQSNGDGIFSRHRSHGPMVLGVGQWSKVIGGAPKPPSNPNPPNTNPTGGKVYYTFRTQQRDTLHTLSYLVNGNYNKTDAIWKCNPGLKGPDGQRIPRSKYDTYLPPNQPIVIKWAARPVNRPAA